MLNVFKFQIEKEMISILDHCKDELFNIFLCRPNVECIKVITFIYNKKVIILSTISTVIVLDYKTITVEIVDMKFMSSVISRLQEFNFNLTIEGFVIKIFFPEVTGDKREYLKNEIRRIGEKKKVLIRLIRQNYKKKFKNLFKKKEITKDDLVKLDVLIQKTTDIFIVDIDNIINKKILLFKR